MDSDFALHRYTEPSEFQGVGIFPMTAVTQGETDAQTEQTMQTLTRLVDRYAAGDDTVLPELTPTLYSELRRIAHGHMRHESSGHTMQATAVVHEAYMRLSEGARAGNVHWQSRFHFVRLAARVMRNLLVDHARAKQTDKRGGHLNITSLDRTAVAFHTRCSGRLFDDDQSDDARASVEVDFIALDAAVEALRRLNPRQAEVVDLRFFSDLSNEDTADALGVSLATVKRDWAVARLFLQQAMSMARTHAG
jgi:RNA polymerase sigma-70 factor, ECF subfamily